jgi:hypothetical protein
MVSKNATDAAMVIDAMDLLYSGRFDGFCVVSSDSDFTRLAARIRESGLIVYGFGERKTPKPFVAACDKFVYIENLTYAESPAAAADAVLKPPPRSDFDSRNYGYAKLSDLMAATTLFELDRRSPGDGKSAVVYARDKRRRPDKKPKPTPTNP